MRVRDLRTLFGYKTWLALALTLSLIGLGLVLLPELVRYLSLRQLRDNLKAQVSIEDVDLNLFTGRAQVSNLVIGGSKTEPPILRLPSLEIRYSLLGLLQRRIQLDSVRLIQPELFLERTGPASFNLTGLARPVANGQEESPWNFTLEKLAIRNGQVTLVDHTVSPVFKSTLEDVTLQTGTISSLPELSATPTSFELRVQLDQGRIMLKGEATPIARPVGLKVTARWENLDPAMFKAYFPSRPVIDFSDSVFSGEAQYVQLHGNDRGQTLTVSFNTGPIAVSPGLGQEPVFRSQGLETEGVHWDFLDHRGEVEKVILRQPDVLLKRHDEGPFTVAQLFPESEEAIGENQEPQKAQFPFAINDLRLEAGSIRLSDHKVNPPVEATFTDLNLKLKDLLLVPEAKPGQLNADARLENGEVQVKGTLQPIPFDAQFRIGGTNLPLETFQGYLQTRRAPLHWEGQIDGEVELGLATQNNDSLAIDLKGELEARELALGVPGTPEPPIQARQVKTTVLGLRTDPSFFVDIESLELLDAYFRVARGSEGKWNLNPLWQAPSGQPQASSGQTKESSAKPIVTTKPFFRIGKLTAKESVIQFIDTTVTPAFRTRLTDLGIEMGPVGPEAGRAPLSVRGKLNETTELELEGWVKAFSGPLQISLDGIIRDYDLENLNPYSTQYIRYEIERGHVTTDAEYSYDAGDLRGENQFAIRHLRLGDRLGDEFEEQIGVSLRLALALLEDSDGQIRLRVPVSGDLRKPKFDFGALIWKAVRNALVKALTAPLRFLGTIVTVGGRITEVRIDPIAFFPGSLEPRDDGERRLQELAELLKNKPRLELEVRAVASEQELPGLKQRLLRKKIDSMGEEYEQALSRLYRLSRNGQPGEKLPGIDEMEAFLAENLVPPPNALADLAENRANFVKNALIKRGVAPEKLHVESEDVTDDQAGRVEFELLS
ncbi:MAG TPA: DUF748 domain-containing protein [Candidatus Binatia bacterium]|nr:DUF748 domain-containing protein [Candidatus Binatia bacterium]